MKRFIAYISLCVTMLIAAVISIGPSVKNLNSNIDYDYGKEYVYKIEKTDDSEVTEEDIENVSEQFIERLNAADVTTYKLESIGNDTLRLQYRVEYGIYDEISTLLTMNPNFSIMSAVSSDSTFDKTTNENKDIFVEGSAVVEQDPSGYPTVVLTLNTSDDSLSRFNEMRKEAASKITTDEEGNTTIPDEGYLYFMNNWKDSYSLESIIGSINGTETNVDTEMMNSYMFRLDSRLSGLFYDYDSSKDPELNSEQNSGDDETIETPPFKKIAFRNYSGNHSSATQNIVQANKEARIWAALFNTSANDYSISCINIKGVNGIDANVPPFKESLINLSNILSISGSTLLYATIAAFIVVTAFLILNYGIAGLLASGTGSLITILPLTLISLFGAEFNVGAILGLIAISMLATFTSVNYFKKVKNEMYKGKKLKKANQDVSRATFLNLLDLSVVTLIFGVVAFLIPNSIIASIGTILIIGSIFNFVINGLFLRLGYWLLANSSIVNQKLSLLQIDNKLIPDLAKEEKPVYFEAFKTKITKKSKIISSAIFATLLIASVIGLTTFQTLTGNIYSNDATKLENEIVLKVTLPEEKLEVDSSIVEALKDSIYTVTEEDAKSEKAITFKLKESYINETYKNSSKTLDYYVILTSSEKDILDTTLVYYQDQKTDFTSAITNAISDKAKLNLSLDTDTVVKEVKNINYSSINYYVLVFVSIAIGITSIYLLFRFNISRTLTSILTVGSILTMTVGIFSLIHRAYDATITLGIVIVGLIIYYVLITLFDAEKKYYINNKVDVKNLEARSEAIEYSKNLELANLIITLALVIFTISSFAISSSIDGYGIILVVIGILLGYLFIRNLLPLIETSLMRLNLFIKNHAKLPKIKSKRRKEKPNVKNKGDGPEEAIFYGIND